MKQVLLIIGIIVLSITANSQDISINYGTAPIDQGNYIYGDTADLLGTPENCYQHFGEATFNSDFVFITFKYKKLGRRRDWDLDVTEVSHQYNETEDKTISTFKFEGDTDSWPYKGDLVMGDNRWELYLYHIGGDITYFSGSTGLGRNTQY